MIMAYMNWSGGKDSALALYKIMQQPAIRVSHLLTSLNAVHNRISMHGVRRTLLEKQGAAIGMPLMTIELPENLGIIEYEAAMSQKVNVLKQLGCSKAIFGDIFLEDLRLYREEKLKQNHIECIFPLWKKDTNELMQEFIALGFKAIIVCVNGQWLDKSFCGRLLDQNFLNDLPANVDLCGENGEYHSFVFDGPLFSKPVAFKKGETFERVYKAPLNAKDNCFTAAKFDEYNFYFCDLISP